MRALNLSALKQRSKILYAVLPEVIPDCGSMIKYNHSYSVIIYYTRWYAVHSITASYLRHPYIMWHIILYHVFHFLLKLCWPWFLRVFLKYNYTIQSVIMIVCAVGAHFNIIKINAFAPSPCFIHTLQDCLSNKCPLTCVHNSDSTRKDVLFEVLYGYAVWYLPDLMISRLY